MRRSLCQFILKYPHRDYRMTFELLKLIYDKQAAKVESSEQLIVMGDSAGDKLHCHFPNI